MTSKIDLDFNNIIYLTDSYKPSHYLQYPADSEYVYSYLESRGGWFEDDVFVLLQLILHKYLAGVVVTQEKIDEAEELLSLHLPNVKFNREGWEYILKVHKGKLPIQIKAVPEGTVVRGKNVLMTVVNTDPKCFWLTNYLESLLLHVWYPITVATLSREMKKTIGQGLLETGDISGIDFKLHDFGFRGVSSVESAMIGGAAHLVNFMGTDTLIALPMLRRLYGARMAGFSIPASEQSTITSWGRQNEGKAFKNMLDSYPEGLVACVSDSYNIWEACENLWGTELKDQILNRNGTLVVRPDSGDPITVVPRVIDVLMSRFGFTINSKGYKVLPPQIRVIQGDGIAYDSIKTIVGAMISKGLSIDNVAFGSGGGLLQKVDRDSLKFAFKCSAIRINGEWADVYKEPVDDSFKKSKRGRMKLIKVDEEFATVHQNEYTDIPDELETVFLNGEVTKTYTWDEIRARAAVNF
jgi:nicotinamide phosphoribosyltransferase